MESGLTSPVPIGDSLVSPKGMRSKGMFGIVRVKRKLQRETPPRMAHATSEASFESHRLPKLIPLRKKGAKEQTERMVLRHLQLDSSLLYSSGSEALSDSNHSDTEEKEQAATSPPPKDFIEELIQKYSAQGQVNLVDMASRTKAIKPVQVFWEKKHGLGYIPSAREGATLTLVNRRLYLFAGESRSLFNDVMILNPETWRWEAAPLQHSDPPPEPRSGHSTVNYKNCLVVFGGGGSFNQMIKSRKCYNRVHIFDTVSNTWTTPSPYGNIPQVRRNHAAALVGTTMILYGGMDELGNPLDDLCALNMETMRWFTPRIHRSCTVRPGKRHSLCMVPVYSYGVLKQFSFDIFHVPNVHDDTFSRNNSGIYMFGGVMRNGRASNDLFVLKPKKIDYKDDDYYLKWVQPDVGGTPPEPRYSYCAALRGKYIAFFGGRNDEFHSGGLAVKSIALLNVESMRWENVISHGVSPAGRWGSCMASRECHFALRPQFTSHPPFHTKMVVFGGMRIDKYCSGKLIIAETDPLTVKEQEAELKYIQGVREQMGRNAFERMNRATLIGVRSGGPRVFHDAAQTMMSPAPLPRNSE